MLLEANRLPLPMARSTDRIGRVVKPVTTADPLKEEAEVKPLPCKVCIETNLKARSIVAEAAKVSMVGQGVSPTIDGLTTIKVLIHDVPGLPVITP